MRLDVHVVNNVPVASGKWQVASGKWQVASGKWQVASGKWQVASGQVASGKWQVASGKWQVASGEEQSFMRRAGEENPENSRIMLGLLDAVEQDRAQSQRLLASELGIALGLVNVRALN